MYLYIQPSVSSDKTECFPLLTSEDFETLLKEFPSLESSFAKHLDLFEAVQDMAYQLSSHHMTAWVSFDKA